MQDLTGQKFERLIVIKRVNNDKWGHLRWLCKCICKNRIIINGYSLKNGNTKSCGCLCSGNNNAYKHGHSKNNRTYYSWQSMIQRCTNSNSKSYKDYGSREIKVCKRWMKFENFLKDMAERPTDKHSIDRIDNNGDYNKTNCRWATPKQQARNKNNNHLISFGGKIQCIVEWSEETRIPTYIIQQRINRSWSIKKTLTTPVKKYKQRKNDG